MKLTALLIFSALISLNAATISGFVRDSKTSEAVFDVNVYIEGTGYGTASNMNGYFVISGLKSGSHTLIASSTGYRTFRESFVLLSESSKKVEIKLEAETVELEELNISIEADELTDEVMNIRTGQLKLKPRDIRKSATFIQPDLFRSIQTLPGIVSVSDYSTGLYVRGGNNDHNLILYDGIPVYNPSHLFGVFSTFITDALRDSKLIKSAYPA
ncbi:MAG: carboxypeptidase-like regulatory domain-containing protein, partial [Candidatus Delongbacteria bacterium]